MNRPLESEYAPYYQGYVARVTEDEILPVLRSQLDTLDVLLNRVAPEHETFRYAEGKWSIREVIGHLIERVLTHPLTQVVLTKVYFRCMSHKLAILFAFRKHFSDTEVDT